MGIFRSERMKHGTLVLPSDRARYFIGLLGNNCNVQFVDMNEQSVNRPYKKYVQRVEEIERILRFLFDELSKLPSARVHFGSIEEFLKNDFVYNFEKIEENLQKLYTQFVKFKDNNADLLEQKNAAMLEKYVAIAAISQLKPKEFSLSMDDRNKTDVELLLNSENPSFHFNDYADKFLYDHNNNDDDQKISMIIFSNVAGVILTSEQERFSRTLFRATRGNAYTLFQLIPEGIKDADTGKFVSKSVFVVYYQGSKNTVLYEKILKICKAFGTHTFNWPRTHESAIKRVEELERIIENKEKALYAYEHYIMEEIYVLLQKNKQYNNNNKGSSLIEEWRRYTIKEKYIYHTLNLFEGTDITLRADCWFPETEEENIRRILINQSNQDQVSAFLLSDKSSDSYYTNAPTYIKVNEFTRSFQNFVDTYGVPRYREANPAILTIVTLPFLFGVMFGDIGHGLCIFFFSLFLIFYKKTAYYNIDSNNELLQIMIGGRYMILLMSLFAIYAGFLYNDFFSIGLNIFGTRWIINQTEKKNITQWTPGKNFPYPFGFDPKWKGATNELIFFNSFKMKFSIIVGFVQMLTGIILKATNAIHFNKMLDFFFEFIPQICFFCSLVGYMVLLIIYKWATSPEEHNKPMLITTIINMCMFEHISPENIILKNQQFIQKVLVIVMIICVPIMLFTKPLLRYFFHKKKKKQKKSISLEASTIDLFNDPELQIEDNMANESYHTEEEDFNFGEEFIHQVIETIEFVLGTLSNTASYLRLWALSLAHQQLALVFYEKTILLALNSTDNFFLLSLALFVGYAAFACITLGVMLCMDSLECFLHALRLQWVEFQNKFYHADGYAFLPLNFQQILSDSQI